jgi:hypothetical protein
MDPTTNGADPTLPLQAYNGTLATGGDSRVDNLNVYYNVSLLGGRAASGRGANCLLARRHRLDDHSNCSRASYDSRSWVSARMYINIAQQTNKNVDSSTRD